jgi:carboxypeptidase C (cathepsin A)
MTAFCWRLLFLLISGSAIANAAIKNSDEIKSLVGWPFALPSRQYSGYLNIRQGKHLHYVFVESESNPETDPVVLWLNGGPGCSSMEGYLFENGPFHIKSNNHRKLNYNDQTWSKIANVIYLEAPAGVGFRY